MGPAGLERRLCLCAARGLSPTLRPVKLLFVHAHFDDFEFTAAGTFELWRRKLGDALRRRVLICTDGQAGHHWRGREETGEMRLEEQRASARLGGYEFELLRLPDGRVPREGCLAPDSGLLAALWRGIREFQPDYLFCPPLPDDPLAGVHPDHLAVAEAVRRVAYMINVPQAFTPEYPAAESAAEWIQTPVILLVHDPYSAGANAHDLAVDVEPAFDQIAAMSWCHQSQIREWLPWVGRHKLECPESPSDWAGILRRRFAHKNRALGLAGQQPVEVFTVSGWGHVPTVDQLLADFPTISPEASHLARLRERLARWGMI